MSEIVKIYRGEAVIHEFIAEDSFSRQWGLMGDNYISFSLKAKENVSLLYGDYILLDDEKFTLFNTVNVTEADGIKEYPLTFYGEQYFTNRCIIEDEGATTFSYFGGVSDHMTLVKLALDKYGLSRFTLGTIEENGSQLIEYDNTKGLDAINKICEAFNMEWEFAGDVINIKKRVGVDTSYRFEYGKGKGAYSVSLKRIQNTSIVTRLIVKGATTNLPKDYASTDTPKRLNLGSEVLDRNTDRYGVIPDVMINEEIYPRLIGRKVVGVDVPADIENATRWKLKLDIPFDLAAQYAPDEKPEVKFQTGDLAGNSFEIVENSWNAADKTLEIIVLDQEGEKLPSKNRQPKVGDEFVLLNILMPNDPYVTDAIKELKKWGEEQLKIVSEPQFAPSLTADPKYIKENDVQLHPGDGIVVVAGSNEIHIRIQKITFPLTNKRQLAFELGNNVMYSYEQKVANDLQDITSEVQSIKRDVHNVDRRGWRDAKEVNARLEGIEESAALIGTEGGQLIFSGTFQANVNSHPNSFLCTEGRLQHFIYKENPTGGIWDIGGFDITLQEDVLYSIYAKCNKSNSNGIIYVSKEKIDIKAEEGYYYFFLGTISSIFEGARSIRLVTGYTSITGGYLTGQVIQDARQRLVIDLPNATITAREGATIRGRVEIKSIDGEYKDAETVIDEKATVSGSAAAQEKIDNLQIGTTNILTGSCTAEGWTGFTTHNRTEYSLTQNGTAETGFIYSDYVNIGGGQDVVLSFESKCTDNITHCDFHILPDDFNTYGSLGERYEKASGWKRFVFKYKTPEIWGSGDAVVPVRLRVDFNGTTDGEDGTVWVRNVQIEYGNVVSSYSIPEADREYIAKEEAARQAQEKVDGIQIGGENLINNSEIVEFKNVYTVSDHLKSNTNYVLSAEKIEIVSGEDLNSYRVAFVVLGENLHKEYYANFTKEDVVVKVAIPGFDNCDSVSCFIYAGDGLSENTIRFTKLKLEEGNIATAWTPSLYDQQKAAIDRLQVGGTNLVNGSSPNWVDARNGYPRLFVDKMYLTELRGKEISFSGYIKGTDATANEVYLEIAIVYKNETTGYYMYVIRSRGNFEEKGELTTTIKDKDISAISIYPVFRGGTVSGSIQVKQFQIELGNKVTSWKPSVKDQLDAIDKGIDSIQIGVRNLLLKSNIPATNGGYLITKYYYTEPLVVGETYTMVFSGKVDGPGKIIAYTDSGATRITEELGAYKDDVYKKTFVYEKRTGAASYDYFAFFYTPNGSEGTATINWAIVVKGNKAPDMWIESQEDTERRAVAQSWSGGKILYSDPTFKEGVNGISVYDNTYSGNVSIERITKQADSPISDSNYNLKIVNTGPAVPSLGGFAFRTQSRASAVFICRFIAKVPSGYSLEYGTNAFGSGGTYFFATDTRGTGKWEEYILVAKCGSTGNFSTTMFFDLTGNVGTPDSPVVWYLAYASVFDVTTSETPSAVAQKALLASENAGYLNKVFGKDSTIINGGVVLSSIIGVKNSAGVVTAGMVNGEDAKAKGLMMFAGATSASAMGSAPFRVMSDGSMYSSKGVIGGFTISASSLVAGSSGSAQMLLSSGLIRFTESTTSAVYVGSDVYPSSLGGAFYGPMRVEVDKSGALIGNIGAYINVKGAVSYDDNVNTGNHALYIPHGDVCGFRPKLRRIKTTSTLTNMDFMVLCVNDSFINLYLPSAPEEGQMYFIRQCGAALDIKGNGHKFDSVNKDAMYMSSWGGVFFLVWDRINSTWRTNWFKD